MSIEFSSATALSIPSSSTKDGFDPEGVFNHEESESSSGAGVIELIPIETKGAEDYQNTFNNGVLFQHKEVMPDGRPIVRVMPGSLGEAVQASEALLAETGQYFQRGGTLVRIQVDSATGAAEICSLNPLALVHVLDGLSAWQKVDKRSNEWVPKYPDEKVCKILLQAGKLEHIKPLLGIARQPFMRPDESFCTQVGYDDATGIYGAFDGGWSGIPYAPTKGDALSALGLLEGLLAEFQFARPVDKSAALSAFLTAVLRPSLAAAPMFHVRAPQISSGKSYLCSLIAALATPQRGSPMGFPGSEEECRKLLLSQLMRATPVIEFDNLTSDLRPFKTLCTVLTSEGMEDRLLGTNSVAKVSTRALFLSSGNNVGPIADMTRRCLTIDLDPACDIPAERAFSNPNLLEDVRGERGLYVHAAFTVVRAWIAAGKPTTDAKPLASFNEWSGYCRQALMWLGRPDPATSVFETMANDPERQLLGQLLSEWYKLFGEANVMARDLVARVKLGTADSRELEEALMEISGDREGINTRKLGHWIKRKAGVVVNGLRVVKAPKTRNVENWRAESVKSIESGETPMP